MPPADGASSITVAVRVRPFTIREAAQLTKPTDSPLFLGDGSLAATPTPKAGARGIRSVLKVVDDRCLIFDPPEDVPVQRLSRNFLPAGKRSKDQTFAFDRVFDENITQGDVYEATTRGLLDSVLDGYNATVFAYGATGCGKTHTITGTSQQPGIIFLTMQELFERISEKQEEMITEVTLSYLEIYNETIRDLLAPAGPKQGLMLREDSHQAVSVAGLSSHHPRTVEEVMDMLVEGNAARTSSPTDANATSSRSHAVLQINVARKDRNADISEPTTMATLSIIDLAGSERASATRNRGERLLEGANINKSLLALGSCINALCDPRKRNHVPYRNSKLTRLLKFSLGGNCKTVMIVCVSPSSAHFDETQNTLRYANRAKNIQTKVVRNVFNVDRHVKDYLVKINEQTALINELKEQQKEHEALAMTKFRKLEDKRTLLAKDGIARMRSAFQHSANERKEKVDSMKRLRHLERRVAMITTWIAGFDAVCETRDAEDPPASLTAMRKTAHGILAELESSIQHQRQQLAKTNWERALDSALQNSLRQLQENGVSPNSVDSLEVANLKREAELLKCNADREAHMAVLDQERSGGEVALVQVLLQAQFETIAILGQIMQMDEQDAVRAARDVLGKLLASSTEATAQVIRPDGGLQITHAVPPSRGGTPRKKKPVSLMGPSPMKNKIRPSLLNAAHLRQGLSPMSSGPSTAAVGSPGRRKLGSARKSLAFARASPRKRSPVKITKRGVRWRDDTEDGALADFQPTPTRPDETPEGPSTEAARGHPMPVQESPGMAIPPAAEPVVEEINYEGHEDNHVDLEQQEDEGDVSEAIDSPTMPSLTSLALIDKPRSSNRFDRGFLAKKTDGSPSRPLLSVTPADDGDAHAEPIRHPSPLQEIASNVGAAQPPVTTDNDSDWRDDKDSVRRISSAMKSKRSSLGGAHAHTHHGHARRDAKRRSPSAQLSASPDGGLFSASHARRMVKSEKGDEWRTSAAGVLGVLSPRSAPVVKSAVPGFRRSTFAVEAAQRDAGAGGSGGVRSGQFRSSIAGSGVAPGLGAGSGLGSGAGHIVGRPSMSNSKTVWR